jgi:hypothetical protein
VSQWVSRVPLLWTNLRGTTLTPFGPGFLARLIAGANRLFTLEVAMISMDAVTCIDSAYRRLRCRSFSPGSHESDVEPGPQIPSPPTVLEAAP